jgi:outer membrane protein OmpA-like peptidoglycan-associated protein
MKKSMKTGFLFFGLSMIVFLMPAGAREAAIQVSDQPLEDGQRISGPSAISGVDFPKVKTSDDERLARKFSWWPTDSKPAPFKDPNRSGYWWWPEVPGQARPWGNQGYIYVRKIIFDYKSTEETELKPSLVIKRVLKNIKVYFDYDKSELRPDAIDALSRALYTLEHNLNTDILITGNADVRGSEQYNQKLGERRALSVRQYLLDRGLPEERIRILSRGKLDAMAPTNDLEGMQKDRNAQFMIAEVEEVMIPASQAHLYEDKLIEEREIVEGEVRVDTKDYVIQKGDTLWAIAKREYGNGMQWKRIYEFNKDVISNPDRPKKGTRIKIPIE